MFDTLDLALEAKPAAFAVVQIPSGSFIPVANAATEREIHATHEGAVTVWAR